jgi:hypothetical protein
MMDLMKIAEPEINVINEAIKALIKKLEAEPKENWQASMAYEWVERVQDVIVEVEYHLERIVNRPKPADFKHWRDKDDHFPV